MRIILTDEDNVKIDLLVESNKLYLILYKEIDQNSRMRIIFNSETDKFN